MRRCITEGRGMLHEHVSLLYMNMLLNLDIR